MDVSAAKELQKMLKEATRLDIRVLWAAASARVKKDLSDRHICNDEDDVFGSTAEAVLWVEEQIVGYCQKMHREFLNLHPVFVHHQALMNEVASFSPFGD